MTKQGKHDVVPLTLTQAKRTPARSDPRTTHNSDVATSLDNQAMSDCGPLGGCNARRSNHRDARDGYQDARGGPRDTREFVGDGHRDTREFIGEPQVSGASAAVGAVSQQMCTGTSGGGDGGEGSNGAGVGFGSAHMHALHTGAAWNERGEGEARSGQAARQPGHSASACASPCLVLFLLQGSVCCPLPLPYTLRARVRHPASFCSCYSEAYAVLYLDRTHCERVYATLPRSVLIRCRAAYAVLYLDRTVLRQSVVVV